MIKLILKDFNIGTIDQNKNGDQLYYFLEKGKILKCTIPKLINVLGYLK